MKTLTQYLIEKLKVNAKTNVNKSLAETSKFNFERLYKAIINEDDALLFRPKDIREFINSIITDYGLRRLNLTEFRDIFRDFEDSDFVGCALTINDGGASATYSPNAVDKEFDNIFKKSYTEYVGNATISIDDRVIAWLKDKNDNLLIICDVEPCYIFINNYDDAKLERYKRTTNKTVSKKSDGKYHPKDREQLEKLIYKILGSDRNADLNNIDVYGLTDLSNSMFYRSNPDISKWDVSKCKDMQGMFQYASINTDLSKWDVSNVENMSNMFLNVDSDLKGCHIEDWDVSNVKNMRNMFAYSDDVNIDLSKWNPKNVDRKTILKMFVGSPMEKNPPKWWKDIYRETFLNMSYKEKQKLMYDDEIEMFDKICKK